MKYASLGLDIVLAVVICTAGGHLIDNYVGARATFTMIGFALGVIVLFSILFQTAKKFH